MSEFNFKTGNGFIDGKVTYSVSAPYDIDSLIFAEYKVSYTISLHRNNKHTGTPTNHSMSYYVYSDGATVVSGYHQNFTVPNIKEGQSSAAWATVAKGSYTVSVGAFSSGKHTIGISMTSPVTGLTAEYQTDTYSIDAYRTKTGASSIESITDLGNNSVGIKTKMGENGRNNDAINCMVFGTTNGQDPKTVGYSFYYTAGKGEATKVWTLQKDNTKSFKDSFESLNVVENTIKNYVSSTHYPVTKENVRELYDLWEQNKIDSFPLRDHDIKNNVLKITDKKTKVWVRPVTISNYSEGDNYDGESVYGEVYFYEPPEWIDAPKLMTTSTKSTHRSEYKVDWTGAVRGKNPESPKKFDIYKYMVYLKINDNETITITPDGLDPSKTQYEFGVSEYGVKKGDVIKVIVEAYDKFGDGTDLTAMKDSNSIVIESSGVVNAKVAENKWTEGQIYIKTPNGWREALGVFTKVDNSDNGWKESI